jgi:hypothetical protein
MAYQNATNQYQNTKYVVSSAGNTPYATIQSAINAANTAGIPAIVYIRPGTYTENLTLYSHIDLEGSESTEVIIVGTHTPPNAGSLSLTRIGLSSTTHILSSAAAGTTALKLTRCNFTVTNGYICNLANWTGSITFKYCDETGSTNNGVVNNAGASIITIKNSQIGSGTGNTFLSNGSLLFNNADIGCPITLSGAGVSVLQGGSTLRGTISATVNADLQISNSRIVTGTDIGLVASSTVAVKLSNVIIDCTNTYAVSGTTSYKPNEVTFPNSKGVNPTVTEVLTGVVKTGEIYADTILRMNMTGFFSWAAAGPYYDSATLGTFKLLVGGTGYIGGKLITWVAQNISGMTSGSTWWIYIDSTGTIGKTNARTGGLFVSNIVLFQCLYDETSGTKVQYTVKENHNYDFSTSVSNYNHDVIGTVIVNASNGANITLVGPANVKISISGADELEDHGLETTIPDSGGVGVVFNKMYTTAAGKWARDGAASDTFLGRYNNAGTPTTLGAGRWGVYRLYISKDDLNAVTPTYFAILDIVSYGSSAAATTAIGNDTPAKATNELYYLELAQLGFIIFRQSTAQITSVIISKTTLRSTTSSAGTDTASLVNTNTTNFNNLLSASDTNVQAALDTLDDIFLNIDLATTSPKVYFKKYRAAAALTSGDLTGTVKFGGYDGTQVTDSARITSTSSGTIASTRVAGDLMFYTHPDSAAADPTLRMTIASTGAITVAAPDAGTALTVTSGGITCSSGNVAISSGNLTLPDTTSTVGQIVINALRFLHTGNGIDNGNIFLGRNAGNFTGSGSCISNVVAGNSAATSFTDASRNIILGETAGVNITTSARNIIIGHNGGSSITTATGSNIYLNVTTSANESNTLRIGNGSGSSDQQLAAAYIHGIYGVTPGGTLNVALVDSNGQLGSVANLAVAQGGTGAGTLTDHGILLGSGTGAITPLGEASNGQIPIGSTGNDPVLATITAGTNMTVTNGAGTITLSSTTVGINPQTDSYTLVLGDAGKLITMTKGSANTLTVPKNSSVAFATGTFISIYQGGAGTTTIAPVDGDVTIRSEGSALALYGQYAVAGLIKIGADEWVAYGDLA